jgi:hypothetical protein
VAKFAPSGLATPRTNPIVFGDRVASDAGIETGSEPEQSQTVVPTTTVELPIGSIATFQLINPKHDFRYECRWKWSEQVAYRSQCCRHYLRGWAQLASLLC